MKALTLCIASSLLLVGCGNDVSARINDAMDDAIDTASGRITEIQHRIDKSVKPVVETVNDVQNRVKTVQNGIQKVQDGITDVQGAVER